MKTLQKQKIACRTRLFLLKFRDIEPFPHREVAGIVIEDQGAFGGSEGHFGEIDSAIQIVEVAADERVGLA